MLETSRSPASIHKLVGYAHFFSMVSMEFTHAHARLTLEDFRYPAKTTTQDPTFPSPKSSWNSLRNRSKLLLLLFSSTATVVHCTESKIFFRFSSPIKLATHTHSVELFPHFFLPGCARPVFSSPCGVGLVATADGRPVFLLL